MPYSIQKKDSKYCVVRKDTGESKGCSNSRAQAEAHMRALYAAEEAQAIVESFNIDDLDGEDFTAVFNTDGAEEFAWEGPIVFEGQKTGDNRIFKPGAIKWDPETLPWAFRWQRSSIKGHEGAVPIGRVDNLERREDGAIYGYGVIIPSLNSEAAEYLRLIQAGVASGVSVDGDSAEFDVQEEDSGQQKMVFSSMRLRSLTAVDIPAFNQARVGLTADGDCEECSEEVFDLEEEFAAGSYEIVNWGGDLPFCLKPKALGDAGEEGAPELKAPLKCFKTEEEAKAFIAKAPPADKVAEKVEPGPKEIAKAEAASVEDSEELGGKPNPGTDPDMRLKENADEEFKKKKKKKMKVGNGPTRWTYSAISASAIPVKPHTEWFENPQLDGPTPITVNPDGSVYGHLALFNTCHIGFPGACVKPPKGSEYRYFHTGEIETAEGETVEVGHLTFNTGHAAMNASPKDAASHYDNTGTVAADVRCGEDEFGIWVAGGLRPHLTDSDIRSFRAAPLSGDWRRIAGRMELVGALAVNVPGFPVPRAKVLVASGETETLFTFMEDEMDDLIRSKYKAELARRTFSVTEFHLPGEHDQSDHAGGRGAANLPTNTRDFVGKYGGLQINKLAKTGLSKLDKNSLLDLDKTLDVAKRNDKVLGGIGVAFTAAGLAAAAAGGGPALAVYGVALTGAAIYAHAKANAASKNIGYEKRKRNLSFSLDELIELDAQLTEEFAINYEAVDDNISWEQAMTLAKKSLAGVQPKEATSADIANFAKAIDDFKKTTDVDEDPHLKSVFDKSDEILAKLGKGESAPAEKPGMKKISLPTPKAKAPAAPAAPSAYDEDVVEFAASDNKKSEDGTEFPASDYAYVPDPTKPSTWKLRLTKTPGGDPDPGIVGAAIAALGKGFRGNKVEIPAADRAKVVAKVRAAWKKANPDKKPDEMPDVIKG